ncbi:hypothetical protein GUJ93_ZPchr0011g26924 [Zizania palustris]|uniref:Elongation factor P C-terminal domain-containing protein n=1 Tax=Zizania palustris TaxID=103762 RepID=A0A8J6BNT7_ZIZPA|nr:hypothetical protein GUJ93_ZPchr0011g26924 [Zizania palustris]
MATVAMVGYRDDGDRVDGKRGGKREGQGDSAQGGTKPATVETGVVFTVPPFVNVGDDILIDSITGQYMNRE